MAPSVIFILLLLDTVISQSERIKNFRHVRSKTRAFKKYYNITDYRTQIILEPTENFVAADLLSGNQNFNNNFELIKEQSLAYVSSGNDENTGVFGSQQKNRQVTVEATTSNWQKVEQTMLYMGERTFNRLENTNNRTKLYKHENKIFKKSSAEKSVTQHSFEEYELKEVNYSLEKTGTESANGHVDIVTRFLRIVESQQLLGSNCTAGTDLSLGEGVVDRYAQERFRVEANVAVNRANMLTRLWKYANTDTVISEYLLHASVFSMVEFDDDIFAAGNCYDQYQYKDYWLFCPYAYRLPEGSILVKDLAVEYKYLSNTSEWFYIARKNAEKVIANYNQFSRGKIIYDYSLVIFVKVKS